MTHKIISVILAIIFALSVSVSLTSCVGTVAIDAYSISYSASDMDALEAAVILEEGMGVSAVSYLDVTERLSDRTATVIIGTMGTAEEFGIDMSEFNDSGYIIRRLSDHIIIFGKTEDSASAAASYFTNIISEKTLLF